MPHPAFRIEDGHWIAVDHPRVTMPVSRLAALRGVPLAVAHHPEWQWTTDHWTISWPSLNLQITEYRLRTLITRWMLIQLSQRRAHSGEGSQPYRGERTMIMPESWRSLLAAPPAPFAICGGMAVNYYARPRHTQDLDIVVLSIDWKAWDTFLSTHGFKRQGPLHIGGWTYAQGSLQLDVLTLEADWVAQAIAEAHNIMQDSLPILPLAWLVWMKLDAGRTTDQSDISHMLGPLSNGQFDAIVIKLTPRLSPEDREDLEALYHLGKLEAQGPDE